MGIYADFLYNATETRYGRGPIETMSGPTLGPLIELGITGPLKAIGRAMEGKDSNYDVTLARGLWNTTPFVNIWYAKAALDHLILHQVLELLSPGYLQSMRQRFQRERGQDYWWTPGELTPERGPDMQKAIE